MIIIINMMYWLSQNGGPTSGPFAEKQLHGMWLNGIVLGEDQICPTHMADAGVPFWTPLGQLLDALEADAQEKVNQRNNAAMLVQAAQKRYEIEKKTLGTAIGMSIFLPMGGQCYTKQWGQVLAGFCICLTVVGAPFVWLASLCDCPGSVRRYNQRLSESLGL